MASHSPADNEANKRKVEQYFLACNRADRELFHEALAQDCEHYFPPGVGGVYRGPDAIADLWIGFVRRVDSRWTIDRIIAEGGVVAVEWTHWKPRVDEYIRGSEWYTFDANGKISRIWAHYASPRDESRRANELDGYDYHANGYATAAPQYPQAVEAIRQAHLEREEKA
jgi:limonene-1,2-epoxide hydrolase